MLLVTGVRSTEKPCTIAGRSPWIGSLDNHNDFMSLQITHAPIIGVCVLGLPKGACIGTATSISTDLILIELFPPNEPRPSIILSAMVVRRDENGVGVEFSTSPLEKAAELQAFIAFLHR